MHKGLVSLDFNRFFTVRNGVTRGHSEKLFVKKGRINCRKHFYANRVVNQWNMLNEEQVSSVSLDAFKKKLTIRNLNFRFG